MWGDIMISRKETPWLKEIDRIVKERQEKNDFGDAKTVEQLYAIVASEVVADYAKELLNGNTDHYIEFAENLRILMEDFIYWDY